MHLPKLARFVGSLVIVIGASYVDVVAVKAQQVSAANFFEPKLSKQFPPGRTTPCPSQCKAQQDKLNALWRKLKIFDDATLGEWRNWYQATDQAADAMKAGFDADKAVTDAKASKDSAKLAAANAAKAKADANQKAADGKQLAEHQKLKKKYGDFANNQEQELTNLLFDLEKAARDLEKCEKACAQAAPTTTTVTPPPPPATPTGGPGTKLPPIPICRDQAFLDKLDEMVRDINGKLGGGMHGLEGQLANTDENDPQYATLKKAVDELKAEKAAIEAHKAAALKKWADKPCPPPVQKSMLPGVPDESGFYSPGRSQAEGTVYVSTDGTTWCSFGDGTGTYVAITPTDDSGAPIAFAAPGTPPTAIIGDRTPSVADQAPVSADRTPPTPDRIPTMADRTPTVSDTSPPATDRPSTTADTSPPTGTRAPPKTETPPSTTDTPTPTTDTPPVADNPPKTDTPSTPVPDTIVVTIFYKTAEDVVKRSETGSELPSQTQKLLFAEPELPRSGTSKTAQDIAFDRDPTQCRSGPDSTCTMHVHPADRPVLGLASSSSKPSHYRLDLNVLRKSGAVAETTGKVVKPDLARGTPAGGDVVATTFRIGARTFTRLAIDLPYGAYIEDLALYSRILGAKVVIDYCRTTKPGMPLGLQPESLGALNHEVPQATLKIDRRDHARRIVR